MYALDRFFLLVLSYVQDFGLGRAHVRAIERISASLFFGSASARAYEGIVRIRIEIECKWMGGGWKLGEIR